FIKKLAANDRPTRDQAVSSLKGFLSTSRKFDKTSLHKLHMGLFFTMWFSDRPLTQQALADTLASLISVLNPKNFWPFVDAFWLVIAREWNGIDQLRMDKFYLLIRRYLAEIFRNGAKNDWSEEWIAAFANSITSEELEISYDKNEVADGIRYHILDIYLDELERVVLEQDNNKQHKTTDDSDSEDEEELKEKFANVPVKALLAPIEDFVQNTLNKTARERAKKEILNDPRLIKWGVVEEAVKEEEKESKDDEW
ncbi:nucleolar, partial [Nadsonia fulvescens var. elongata DSM 6958]